MLSKSARSLVLLFAFILLAPVVEPGGARINIAEFYIYFSFIINAKKITRNKYYLILMASAIGFLAVTLFTSALASTFLNGHDIFMLRLMVQCAMVCAIFNYRLGQVMKEDAAQFKLLFYRLERCTIIPSQFNYLINVFFSHYYYIYFLWKFFEFIYECHLR